MRTIAEIKKTMTDAFIASPEVIEKYALDPSRTYEAQFSKASIENILFYVFAVCVWTLEALFDTFRGDVKTMVEEQKPHSLRWYHNKTLAYMYGKELDGESDSYNTDGMSEEDIEAAKVVKYCAVSENSNGAVNIKAASDNNGERVPLTDIQKSGLAGYLSAVKDAGVIISIISVPADSVTLDLRIYYNPLVLDNGGSRLDGNANTPIQDAINNYFASLRFNGEVSTTAINNVLQQVDGVILSDVTELRMGAQGEELTPVATVRKPFAGYCKVQGNGLNIQFIAYDASDL
jgi:hypothetical protein